jgi:hypothetical protein
VDKNQLRSKPRLKYISENFICLIEQICVKSYIAVERLRLAISKLKNVEFNSSRTLLTVAEYIVHSCPSDGYNMSGFMSFDILG